MSIFERGRTSAGVTLYIIVVFFMPKFQKYL